MSNILLQFRRHSDQNEDSGRGLGLHSSSATASRSLQLVTEALGAKAAKLQPQAFKMEPRRLHPNSEELPARDTYPASYLSNVSAAPLPPPPPIPPPNQSSSSSSPPLSTSSSPSSSTTDPHDLASLGKTVVASDNDVTNGFVKDGKSLPYVFEANEAGVRKRSSKILPVCGVCGKRFVCVTTMKRHLVTHTGEKPFSCKVCGKQYTQKGNLRVHERTHRNDRPFECNICHQKFYRKEPMQKHQWRQHGVVHFKSRPTNGSSVAATTSQQSAAVDISAKIRSHSPISSIRPRHLEPADVVIRSQASSGHDISAVLLERPATGLPQEPDLDSLLVDRGTHDELEVGDQGTDAPQPIKLKMKFAYQKELQRVAQADLPREPRKLMLDHHDDKDEEEVSGGLHHRHVDDSVPELEMNDMTIRSTSEDDVSLQCIGCLQIFPHKPALKAHQMNYFEDGERPFKCCKCGYNFRQKAHLQKHQWRIHRKSQNVASTSPTITMQDIINYGVEQGLREIPVQFYGKTTSKYYSEVLGLEYEANALHHHQQQQQQQQPQQVLEDLKEPLGAESVLTNNSISQMSSSSNSSSSNDGPSAANDMQPLDLSPVKNRSAQTMRDMENNPLLSQPPLPRCDLDLPQKMIYPVWKKAKVTHSNLPPVLQKLSTSSSASNSKHTNWIRVEENHVGQQPEGLAASRDRENARTI